MKTNIQSEIPLVNNDREAALNEAMDAYGMYLLRLLISFTRNRQEAEDISQQLWVYVFQKYPIEKFKDLPFLINKARNLFYDTRRKQKVRNYVQYTDEPPSPQVERQRYSVEEDKLAQERFWEVFSELRFSSNQKQAFWMSARHDYTYREIAQMKSVV